MTPSRFSRFLVVCGLLLALVGGLVQARPTYAATPTGTITGAYVLNVRSGPGVGYGAITVVYSNNNVTLLGRNEISTWVKIRTNGGTEGWINADFVTSTTAISSLSVVGTATTVEATATVSSAQIVNVRSGDTIQHPVITTVGYNTNVGLLGRNSTSSWAYVRLPNGTMGWINGNLLTPSTPLSTLPVATVPILPTGNPSTPAASAGTATVTAGYLNVRRGDGVAYEAITSVQLGAQLTLLGRNSAGTWVRVRTAAGQEGWVSASYLRYDAGINSLPVSSTPLAPSYYVAYINTAALNVRSGPGLNFTAIGLVFDGQMVTMIARDASYGWVKVQTPAGQIGWIASGLIDPNVAVADLPVASQ